MSEPEPRKVYSAEETEMAPEYNFDGPNVVQGKTYQRLQEFRRRRLLNPELAEHFPDDASVNAALEEYLKLKGERQ